MDIMIDTEMMENSYITIKIYFVSNSDYLIPYIL
jgi:hypothetical protein